MSVTPVPGVTSVVVTGGTAVIAVGINPNGGFIVNPSSADDQGLANVESIFVSPVTDATLHANGVTFELRPGQSWQVIANQSTPTTVNAPTSGHRFSVVQW